jgi:hypothetical protein
MIAGEDLRRDGLQTHLSALMQHATHDQSAAARLAQLDPGQEGYIEVGSLGTHRYPVGVISDVLALDAMETTVLHEAGHWLEGHEEFGSEARRRYQEAQANDKANGTLTCGPFEQAADRRALIMLDHEDVLKVLESDPARIADLLDEDARRYGPFEASRRGGESGPH